MSSETCHGVEGVGTEQHVRSESQSGVDDNKNFAFIL